ncbi:hypothetical protein [Microbacterium paludicola]|uniref:hypothetical protein n=1 Tax=Microbacterium paludicola TaxID=300019 RepID=UPI0011A18A8E|nr:hypothetical protein [Microbacterium paludicola]
MRLTNRFVRVFQWIAPVLLTGFVVFGRGLLGAPLGWMAAIGLFLGPVVALLMYIPPVVFVFDRVAAAARKSRLAYDITSYVLWASLIVMGLTLQDGGDDGVYGSVLSEWGVLGDDATVLAFAVAMMIASVAWLATLAAAITSVTLSRHPGMPPAAPVTRADAPFTAP